MCNSTQHRWPNPDVTFPAILVETNILNQIQIRVCLNAPPEHGQTKFNPTQLTWPNSDVNFPAYLGIRGPAKVLRGANGYCRVPSKWYGVITIVCGF